jgi:hypothetical protein
MSNWIFVDVEARGRSPVNGIMTEFGAVHERIGNGLQLCSTERTWIILSVTLVVA